MALRNAGEGAHIKVFALKILFGRQTVECLENPHYA